MDLAYDDLPYVVKPGQNEYNAETYVGNWYEETVRNTLKRDEFLKKRECGDLSIQRSQTMVDLLLKPVELTPSTDNYLHYGDSVQIVTPGPTCKVATEAYPFKRNYCKLTHLALSSAVPPESIDNAPYLSTDSIISVSPYLHPVVRNSFIIEKHDCPSDVGGVVMYGDVFRIRAFDTQYFPLYIFSAPGIRHHVGATHSANPKVRFSDLATSDTLWCAHPLDPFEKMKMELGVPIPMKTRLLIKHNGSGNNLSMESNFPVLTYFGEEWEATVDTKFDKIRCKNNSKNPNFENIWYFDTDRGWPKPNTVEDRAFEKQSKFDARINVNMANQSASSGKGAGDECDDEQPAAQEDDEDEEEEDECCQEGQEGQEAMQAQQQQQSLNYFASKSPEIQETEDMLSQMSIKPLKTGQRPYDPRTAPQPNAYSYMVQENDPNFPNKKWNCGDTDCCWTVPKLIPQPPPDECCVCVEPAPPGPNPNAPVPFNRLIM